MRCLVGRGNDMRDVNELLLKYREGARILWIGFLREGADFDRVDAFASIRAILFEELVLKAVGQPGFRKALERDPYPFLLVVPNVEPVPVQVNRPSDDRNMYWDDPVTQLGVAGLSLALIDSFDWDDFGYIDLRYYRVLIVACREHPRLVGRQA